MPDNGKILADAIYKIMKDNALFSTLINEGRKRVTLFAWNEEIKKYFSIMHDDRE